MIAVLAAGAVGLLSAFLPFTPAEPYLVAAGATTGTPPVALGVAAAAGQTCGKVLIFLGARRDPLTLAATPAQQTHAPAGDEARAAEGRRRPARRGHRPPARRPPCC